MKQELLAAINDALVSDSDRAQVVQVLIDNIEVSVKQFNDSAEQTYDIIRKKYALLLAEGAAVDLPFLVTVKEHLLR